MCDDGALRLIGGSSYLEGRVEICYNEAWGTICDNQFDNVDASVICRQLGFSRNSNNIVHLIVHIALKCMLFQMLLLQAEQHLVRELVLSSSMLFNASAMRLM